MFLRKVFNDKHDITEAGASFIATRKLGFWLKHIASAMAKIVIVIVTKLEARARARARARAK
jgi:hypothetical protein